MADATHPTCRSQEVPRRLAAHQSASIQPRNKHRPVIFLFFISSMSLQSKAAEVGGSDAKPDEGEGDNVGSSQPLPVSDGRSFGPSDQDILASLPRDTILARLQKEASEGTHLIANFEVCSKSSKIQSRPDFRRKLQKLPLCLNVQLDVRLTFEKL